MLTTLTMRILGALYGIGTGNDDGQTLSEYSLIVGVIAVAIVGLALVVFRTALSAAFNSVLPCLGGSC